ncbi:MAG: Rieske 2Fe-2S domain-containing protein [Woeseiaceae bacterium]|nr:Rieske 2Fe-2S domain-containing protein [Woeseiaceae bacterium]
MLTKERNDLITQTGPGTPMGEMFRSYWLPILLSEELPEPDCPPVRVELLSEKLIAFRDTEGRLGLMDELCAHRRASLWFGRNEEGGLRCPYHGWKYDVTGQCVEVPSEGPEFCKNIRQRAYSLIEKGGILWAYMGDQDNKPPEPDWEFANVEPEQRFVSKRYQYCNWLQAMEGGIDSSHVSFLHSTSLETDPLFRGAGGNKYNLGDLAPVFEVAETEGGLLIGARRKAEDDQYYWRITPWVMPSFTMVPPRGDHPVHGHFWIPINDENCWAWSFDYKSQRELTPVERAAMEDGQGIHCKYVPGTYIPLANKDNDYLMNRKAQKAGLLYSGIESIAIQDASLQESMGPICDRTEEKLAPTDKGIMMARRRIFKAIKELQENGTTPPGVDPAHHRIRSASVLLPRDTDYDEGAREATQVRPGKPHVSV